MVEILDSGGLRAAVYLVAAFVAVAIGARERTHHDVDRLDLLPAFWFASALLLVLMGLARIGGVGDMIADFGRERAAADGWYEVRRVSQSIGAIVVASAWLIGVLLAIWRVPPRRRRFLPVAIALFTLGCFAVVRVISLHHIDTVLYRTDIGGVRVVAIIELALLGATLATMATRWSIPTRRVSTVRGDDSMTATSPGQT